MGLTLRDAPPGFDHTDYQRQCPYCEGRILFHWAELRNAPRGGRILHIVSKCLTDGCGHVDFFDPAISDDAWATLDERWTNQDFYAWQTDSAFDNDPEAAVDFSEEEREKIEARLSDLGYF